MVELGFDNINLIICFDKVNLYFIGIMQTLELILGNNPL